MTTLDEHFGPKIVKPVTRNKTEFSRVPPGAREYCDEWLKNIRVLYEDENYYPDKLDKATWSAEAKKLFDGRGWYRPGFLTWALQEHIRRFKEQGKAPVFTGPMSVNYLWHDYDGHLVSIQDCGWCEKCNNYRMFCDCE